MTQPKRQFYQSYILHCWQERGGLLPGPVWWFSLEDPQTQQRQDFPTLRELGIGRFFIIIPFGDFATLVQNDIRKS